MNLRRYKSEDCREIIKLFYNTVHCIGVGTIIANELEKYAEKNILIQ